MKKQSFRISMIASPLMIVCGLLSPGASARAESEDAACSNQTLRGDYGFAIEGVVLPAPGVEVPVRGVAMTHFDGRGNLSQVDHVIAGREQRLFGSASGLHQSIIGGWQLSGTAFFATGNPFTPVAADTNLNLGESQKPNRIGRGIPDEIPGQRRGIDYPWFVPTDFVKTPQCVSVTVGCPADRYGFLPFVYGNAGRNILDGSWLGLRKSVDDEEFSVPGEEKHSVSIRIVQRSESPELPDAEQPVQLDASRFDHRCGAIGTRWIASVPGEPEVRFLNSGYARSGPYLITGGYAQTRNGEPSTYSVTRFIYPNLRVLRARL